MRCLKHFWLSRPSWRDALFVSASWGVTMPLCILADCFLWRHMLPLQALRIAVIFALGAAIAAPLALWGAKIIAHKNTRSAFAAMFFLLSIGTLGLTAVIFALDFWSYFSQWHGTIFSKLWANQFFFTVASAVYQFLVSGVRLYLPFGLIALVVASMWASLRITR